MNLDVLVARGLPPWQPSSSAAEVEVWDRYDFPMVGTFQTHNRTVLFTLVGDAAQTVSVWAYVMVPAGAEDRFASSAFTSVEQMMEFVEDAFAGNEAVFALAKDLKVWLWTRSEVEEEGNGALLAAATTALSEMSKVVAGRQQSPEILFEAELAQVEVTAKDLADV